MLKHLRFSSNSKLLIICLLKFEYMQKRAANFFYFYADAKSILFMKKRCITTNLYCRFVVSEPVIVQFSPQFRRIPDISGITSKSNNLNSKK